MYKGVVYLFVLLSRLTDEDIRRLDSLGRKMASLSWWSFTVVGAGGYALMRYSTEGFFISARSSLSPRLRSRFYLLCATAGGRLRGSQLTALKNGMEDLVGSGFSALFTPLLKVQPFYLYFF